MKILRRILLVIVLGLLCGGAWVWHEATVFLESPASEKSREVLFDVPQGASLWQIASLLEKKGLVTSARKFVWLARYKDSQGKIQAGRFALNSCWTPERTLDALVNGSPVLYRVTVPEGLTWWQTGKVLADAGLVRLEDFGEIIRDPEFLRHYGIPFATAEGFLMPDTYLLKKPDSPMPPDNFVPASEDEKVMEKQWKEQARSVAGRMVDNFWRKASSCWPDSGNGDAAAGVIRRPKRQDLVKWVILASIVEKETGLDAERPRVAGVYANRLAKNMLLQADPTVAYGLGQDFSGPLKRSQLDDRANPYNTYQHAGLPPGPISSFGTAALKSAIQPEEHDFLYFVAITDGGAHNFSKTLEEHNQAVREYRKQKNGG